MNILIIGSGGREHALAWKIKQSKQCDELFIAPGNAGTAQLGKNINLSIKDHDEVGRFITDHQVELLVIGPEAPLVDGMVDYFNEKEAFKGLAIVGPNKFGAILEGSKDFAKKFMVNYKIPTAQSATFSRHQLEDAFKYLEQLQPPFVLKADGLAAGKGVIICQEISEAKNHLQDMLTHKKFGDASQKVVIEEFLKGIELSVFVLTDGSNYKILPEAKDYKRIGENDEGPNTGGMGSISPVNFATSDFMKKVEKRIVKPTIEGLKKEKIDYRGFIFFGLMNIKGDPYVIEYNVRMGDPEAQAVIPRIQSDIVGLFLSLKNQRLNKEKLTVDKKVAASVVQVAGGYPGDYEKGKEISGLDAITDSIVFHAGTKLANGKTVTNGGRVLAITSLADNLAEALKLCYASAEKIQWQDIYYRKDIGKDLLSII